MRYQTLGRVMGMCLLAAALAGCASVEKKKDNLKARGIEFEGMTAVKIFRF